jgi:multiple sugar transport system substrate-binding protein
VQQDHSPVSLLLYVYNALTEDEFNNFFVNPVKKKYPNITMSMIKKAGQGTNPEDMVSAGTIPDIILVGLI